MHNTCRDGGRVIYGAGEGTLINGRAKSFINGATQKLRREGMQSMARATRVVRCESEIKRRNGRDEAG